MATEIATHDEELEELMKQLEAETGVTAASVMPPVTAAPVAAAMSVEDELLAGLEIESPAAVELPVIMASTREGASSATATAVGVLETRIATVETPSGTLVTGMGLGAAENASEGVTEDPDADLAALEAELLAESAPATASIASPVSTPVAVAKVEPEHSMSFIPGEVLVDPEAEVKAVEPVAAATAEAAKITAKDAFTPDSFEGLSFYTDPSKFRLDTSISDVDLDRCFIEQNSLRAFYGTNAAKSEAHHARLKVKFEVIEAKLYEEERRIAAEEGEKVTEKMLENRVKTNPIWLKAKLAVVDAGGVSDINRALVESLKDRKDMLVQIGADRRGEMQGQARVIASSNAADAERQRATEAAQRAFNK